MLKDVIAKVKDDIGLVREGNIFYLVMNSGKDNTFDLNYINKFSKCLDEVASSEGAAVMITVSTSPKIFSTGFKLEYWQASKLNILESIGAFQLLLAKLICLNVPTMALISGHCYAGGLMLAMAHDFRIMREGSGVLCLSEINLGKTLPPAYDKILKWTMPIQSYRAMFMGINVIPAEALKMQVVTGLFKTDEEMSAQITQFAKVFAPKATYRNVLHQLKKRAHKDFLLECENSVFAPVDIEGMINPVVDIAKVLSAKSKEKL